MNKNKTKIFLIFIFFLLLIKTDYRLESTINCCGDDFDYYSHAYTVAVDFDFDYVFTVCDNAKEICPVYNRAKQVIHRSFMDPADAKGTDSEQLAVYVEVRDQLSEYFKDFAMKNIL